MSKVFKPFKKKPFTQPNRDMCVSTAIKIVLDNQFKNSPLSIKQINRLCKYDGKCQGGISLEFLGDYLSKTLKSLDINFNLKEHTKTKDLFELLQKGIYPIISFHIRDYNKWQDNKKTEVFGDDEPNHHVLIIVDVDEKNEKIKLFNTIHNKFKDYEDLNNIYDEISYTKFLEYWAHEDLIYPCIWFSSNKHEKKDPKGNRTLLEKKW